MASKAQASVAFLLALNLLFFSMVSATIVDVSVCVGVSGLLTIELNGPCCGLFNTYNPDDIAASLCLALNALHIINLDVSANVATVFQKCNKSLPNYTC